MNKNLLIERIKAIWLTDNEAKIYIACLECGTMPASNIALKAKLNRVTTYDTLTKLLHKWLVTTSNLRWIKHYTWISPEIFTEEAVKKAEDFKGSLPFLKSLIKKDDYHPTVRFFEWIDWIKKAYKETLNSSTVIYNYANSKNIRDHWQNYDEEYVEKRKNNKVFLKWLAPDDAQWKKVKEWDKIYYRKTKLLPKKHFQVENEINIFDNKVLIASYEPKPFAIIIESEAVADTQRQIFEVLWWMME